MIRKVKFEIMLRTEKEFYDALDEDKELKFEMIHKKEIRKLIIPFMWIIKGTIQDYYNKMKIFSDDFVENEKVKI